MLGVVALSRTALAGVLLNNTLQAAHVKRGQDTNVRPTYHTVNDDLLSDALHCLYQWCDADNRLPKKGGIARCRTPGGYGAEVFICNLGPVQRCTGIQLSKAISEVRSVGSQTGAIYHQPDPETGGLIYGFEYFCKQGHSLCPDQKEAYDATRAHCNKYPTRMFAYDHIADRRRGTGDFSYIGYTWLTDPTSSATQYTYAFKTLSPSAATPDAQALKYMFADHYERRSIEQHIKPQPRAAAFPSVADSIPGHLSDSPSSGPAPTPTPLASGETVQSADLHVTKSPSGPSPEIVIPSVAPLPQAI